MLKLSHLRTVVAVVECGSLRGASRQLGIAQPTISRSIQELERELGVRLFERTKKGMVMTTVGEMVIRRAQVVQGEMQHTLDDVARYKGLDAGAITLGLSTAGQVALLPKVFAPFRTKYPNVRLKIVEGLFPALEADIRDGTIDIYVGPMPKDRKSEGLLIEPLFANRRIIIARRGHKLANATSVRELGDACWVAAPVLPDTENEVTAIYEAAGMPPPNIVAQATSGMSLISAVASSDLLAPMPHQWMEFIARTDMIVAVPVQEASYAPSICIVRQARLPLAPAPQHLYDLVQRAGANHARVLAAAGEPSPDDI